MNSQSSANAYRQLFDGLEMGLPLLDGSEKPYVNFDNAASTPPLSKVQQAVNDYLQLYSSVHRGTGYKSQLSTHVYEKAREEMLNFLSADPEDHVCIFGKNTTEALNKLARRFPFTANRDAVLVSSMEHHSNDLPWRAVAEVIYVDLMPDGTLDIADFKQKLLEHGERLALVAVTGASNVTGYLNPVHELAGMAHEAGAQIVVDGAQLAPHRAIKMGRLGDPTALDYVAISAHKMYAPLGTGALIGRRTTFQDGEPDYRGGGTVEIVTLDEVTWAGPPDRDEAGSPNTVGAVALAAAARTLRDIGLQAVAHHEAELTAYALRQLPEVPGLQLYGDRNPDQAGQRLGVIPFTLEGTSHFLVAAILGHEFGIGVRSGCFCAHPYVLHLLELDSRQAAAVRDQMLAGDKASMPGLVRASFGLYNTQEEIDDLVDALQRIARGDYAGEYLQDRASGEYLPRDWEPSFERYFSF